MKKLGTRADPLLIHLCRSLSLVCMFASQTDLLAQSRTPRKTFDGNRALAHVEKLVSFGPRPPGSPGISKAQLYITEVLTQLGLRVEHQDFTVSTPNGSIPMKNILARTEGPADQVVILASHYDTKLMHNALFVGANDGGSSTGLVLELARVLALQRRSCALWFVFFDGEEAQRAEWTEADSLYGSRHFVLNLQSRDRVKKIKALILADMVGDSDLVLERDFSSTPWLMDLVIKSAQELGHGKHIAAFPKAIVDDHIPFVQAGIPSVDLIDYSFGFNNIYWHTANDRLDKLSSRSLQIVGEIVMRTLDKLCKVTPANSARQGPAEVQKATHAKE